MALPNGPGDGGAWSVGDCHGRETAGIAGCRYAGRVNGEGFDNGAGAWSRCDNTPREVGMFEAIALDADDTLWENETFFRATEADFAALLSEHADPDLVNARLVATEMRNLSRYGFGIKGFMLSMVQTAIELTEGRIDGNSIGRIIEMGQDMLSHPVHLLEGVEQVLATLEGRHLLLITKGDLIDQERKIAASGLAGHFAGVEILADKTPASYASVLARRAIAPERFLMAGNSMKSDVMPVIRIGGTGVFIPHDLTWSLEHAEPQQDESYHELAAIAQLPVLIDELEGRS
ncbi:HAD family hydrolase [Paracoccus sp. Z330]|uniref:HAD family hydrolase n=1 Tax=Paracoccus onchidii TaxID=3017813 RepID=A0ABT4Z9L4_9RHOB|nr:HAD family hydrolase [Paracoccus onchidii]MDB6176038.1 HAD family hydrolase [Paracoccus onchidii]